MQRSRSRCTSQEEATEEDLLKSKKTLENSKLYFTSRLQVWEEINIKTIIHYLFGVVKKGIFWYTLTQSSLWPENRPLVNADDASLPVTANRLSLCSFYLSRHGNPLITAAIVLLIVFAGKSQTVYRAERVHRRNCTKLQEANEELVTLRSLNLWPRRRDLSYRSIRNYSNPKLEVLSERLMMNYHVRCLCFHLWLSKCEDINLSEQQSVTLLWQGMSLWKYRGAAQLL